MAADKTRRRRLTNRLPFIERVPILFLRMGIPVLIRSFKLLKNPVYSWAAFGRPEASNVVTRLVNLLRESRVLWFPDRALAVPYVLYQCNTESATPLRHRDSSHD